MVHTTTPVLATTSCQYQAHSCRPPVDHNHWLPKSLPTHVGGPFRHIVSPDPVSWPPYPWSPHPQTSTQGCPPQCIAGPPSFPPDRGAKSPRLRITGGRLFSFAPACFGRPGRGVVCLTPLVKRQIETLTSGVKTRCPFGHQMGTCWHSEGC